MRYEDLKIIRAALESYMKKTKISVVEYTQAIATLALINKLLTESYLSRR